MHTQTPTHPTRPAPLPVADMMRAYEHVRELAGSLATARQKIAPIEGQSAAIRETVARKRAILATLDPSSGEAAYLGEEISRLVAKMLDLDIERQASGELTGRAQRDHDATIAAMEASPMTALDRLVARALGVERLTWQQRAVRTDDHGFIVTTGGDRVDPTPADAGGDAAPTPEVES